MFEIVWRVLFLLDTFFDIALILQYTAYSNIWFFFVIVFVLPYILLSIILFLPFYRRALSDERKGIVLQICIIFVYTVFVLPCIVILDLHICFSLIITDLSTTRYYLYYWRLKTLVELTFEAIPQTVILICIASSNENINLNMLYGSLSISIVYLCYYCFVIMSGAKSTGLRICDYIYKYYIMQGMDMIPFQEAITQNLLSDFVLTSENLKSYEWKQLTKDLFLNFSIVKFDISGQQNLHFSLWQQLFECLNNNNLTTLRFKACFIFHPDNIITAPLRMRKRRSLSISIRNSFTRQSGKQYQVGKRSLTSLSNLLALKASLQALLLNVPSLVIVDLSNNCLSVVFREMVKAISKLKKLRELYLAQNRLSESSLNQNLYHMLLRGCVSLQILDLSENMFTDEDVDLIGNAMHKCKDKKQLKNLTMIDLRDNKISNDGANKLLQIMPHFEKLSIELEHNQIDDKLFEHIQKKSAIDLLIE